MLSQLRTSDRLRDAVRQADMILFNVPASALEAACGDPNSAEHTTAELDACLAQGRAQRRIEDEQIVAEITSLRSPSEALIRTTELWQSYYPTLKRLGILEPVAATYHEINADLTEIAGRAGIPTIAAYTAFGGP
ncbi:MAG: hypothetical protein MUQ32_02410, partial [Chloroflexi bacterium]|nr:hypothetical protein [Chloroflexota bacterium]